MANYHLSIKIFSRGKGASAVAKAARVDHRSYARQGTEQIPTVHMGVVATQMEKRGIHTDLGCKSREIAVTNPQIRQLRARIRKLKDWIYAQPLQNAPTMRDMVMGVNAGINLKSQWKKIAALQEAARG